MKYTVTLYLPREVAEHLTVRAIREGRSAAYLIAEMLVRDAKGRRAG